MENYTKENDIKGLLNLNLLKNQKISKPMENTINPNFKFNIDKTNLEQVTAQSKPQFDFKFNIDENPILKQTEKDLSLQIQIGNKETKSNFRNFSYSKKDQYYRKAKEEGFRARSVYKLKEIDQNFKLISGVKNILDLCAAPGSWSQMVRASADENAKICSVDLQAIVPIDGVHTIQGDITKQSTLIQILDYFKNEKVGLVIFDGAPDVTGILEMDISMQTKLITCSLVICTKLLEKGGKFVAKVFKSEEHDFYYDKAKCLFDYVTFYKPSSSRLTSHEVFLVAQGFEIDPEIEEELKQIDLEEIFKIGSIGIELIESEDDTKRSDFKYKYKTLEFIVNLFEVLN